MKPVKTCLAWSGWTIAILFLALGNLRATPTFLSRSLLPDMRGLSRTQEGPDGLRDDDGLRGSPQSIVLLGRIRSAAGDTPRDPATLDQVLGGMACASITGRPDGVPVTHCFPSWAQVAGTLPIETRGTADAAFIFQIGSLASTDGQSSVLTIHGGRETGVVRQITISVTPGGDEDSDTPDPALPPTDAPRGAGAAGPNCDDPSSKDLATFYFRAAPGDGGGHLTFVNHVTGLEVDGAIDEVDVLEMGSTGSPKTVRFSGTCDDSLPPCSFSVLVENQDELVRTDDFGIAVATSRAPDPSLSPAGRASLN